ncbi:MAG: biotin transporter BioY [Clostridiales bacterium]|nr:MAG: biotin transporter BioY [Clostridiales bacterium]
MKLNIRDISEISLFVALMVIGAYIKIPNIFFPTVPITLQLFFCILGGLLLGAKKGLISQVVYIILGLVGLPVFSLGGGIGYVFYPSFGFIIGFAIAAFFVGLIRDKFLKENKIGLKGVYLASFTGFIIVYAIGIVYIYFIVKYVSAKEMGLMAIFVGMIPFMIKDVILTVINGIIVPPILSARRNM